MSEETLNMLREVKVILSLLTRVVTEFEIRLNPEVASQAGVVPKVGLVEILELLVQRIVTSTLRLKTCEHVVLKIEWCGCVGSGRQNCVSGGTCFYVDMNPIR